MEPNAMQVSERRTAGFLPTVWDPDLIISSSTGYKYENHATRLEQLKQATKTLLESTKDATPHVLLSLIDAIHRLGVAYHFKEEIKEALNNLLISTIPSDLFTVAKYFRLLRQNGLSISSEVFNKFLDEDGKFMDNLREDLKGVLSLYEASSLGIPGEDILEEANNFSTRHLKSSLMKKLERNISEQIQLSLEVPVYQRLPWIEARNFINVYQRDKSKSLLLLELAKLDYNVVQSLYLEELKELAKWWKDMNFKEKYPFSRDRLVEGYFYSMGCVPHPQFSKCRKSMAKLTVVATVLDDIYDVYGYLDELEKLTDAISCWDLKAVEDLPEYMRPCYIAIHEHVKEMVEDASERLGMDILPYIKQNWVIYTRGYMEESRWIYSGYIPTFDEYLENGVRTIGAPLATTYAFFGTLDRDNISKHSLEWIQSPDSEFLYLAALIGRLYDDLLTSEDEMERGEVVNAIKCYMVQERVSEEEARDHIKGLISDAWRKLNRLIASKSLPKCLSDIALNTARCWQHMYKKGDWFSVQSEAHKDTIISSFLEPIPMEQK
ncbi:hypothetical protein SLA2020_361450 [Shorea laevis]